MYVRYSFRFIFQVNQFAENASLNFCIDQHRVEVLIKSTNYVDCLKIAQVREV